MKVFLVSALLVSGVCAFAEDNAAPQEKYDDWFTGIGSGATSVTDMKSENATWDFASAGEGAIVSGGKLELDLGESKEAVLTPGDEKTVDTASKSVITIKSTINAITDLPTQPGENVQSALAYSGGQYRVWNGAEWVACEAATLPDGEVEITATFDYTDCKSTSPARSVTYKIGDLTLAPVTLTASDDKSTVGSVAFAGAATVAEVDGQVMEVLATTNDKNFGTVAGAIAEAKTSSTSVTLKRSTDETIPEEAGVTINFNGKTAGGDETTEAYAQDGSTGKTIYQPTDEKMAEVEGGGQALTKDTAKLREFLKANLEKVPAYNAKPANITGDNGINAQIADAGENGLPLWESYELGIESGTSLTLKAAPSAGAVAIPEIDTEKLPGDFDVAYQIGDADPSNDPAAVKIPTDTGTYDVKVLLTPKAGQN